MRVKGILCFTGNHEYEQRLVSSKSVYCVLVERHVYPRTVVSVSEQVYTNPTQRVGLVQSGSRHHLIEN
jgi:hypothetical protein